ncbi:UDP-4-amino-4,6-dideoxy-N-acetyl-beta-L-altrosamine transaminase [bacterium]|nr:UDP-4-amino-4,6-dideoxy-N-acetyl-beta-L-altrosamine transaminase [bacterium]
MIPYGRHWIDEDDIASVVEVLRSPFLTTGPVVDRFERAFADYVGSPHAVAVSNGTAALHAAAFALELGPGDEVIVPPLTFAATANAIVYQGAEPVFADIDPRTLLLDPAASEERINDKTRAMITVDYAGLPSRYDDLTVQARTYGLTLIADACHALGAVSGGRRVGSIADLNTFSFHPVKHMTTGEGGMITTGDKELAERMRRFRNHGVTVDYKKRSRTNTHAYDMKELGYNYRLTDIQAALGISQLAKLPLFLQRRQQIARIYDEAFADDPAIIPRFVPGEVEHACHLYVLQLNLERLDVDRDMIFGELREEGLGVNVHYKPVYLHDWYRHNLGTKPGLCPVAERAYNRMITLPLYPRMTDDQVQRVIDTVKRVIRRHERETVAERNAYGTAAKGW